MNMFLWNILLALTWGMATGQFTVMNLTTGFAIGFLILWFTQRALEPSTYVAKTSQVFRFLAFYLWQLILANLRIAYDVLAPGAWGEASRAATTARAIDAASASMPESLRAPIAAESYVCPGVIAVPLDARTDFEITLLANLITLTPGSVSLDLSDDRRVLYVHAMYIDDGDVEAYRRSIKEGLERRVLELFR